jgi:signal transduction histidine kinase
MTTRSKRGAQTARTAPRSLDRLRWRLTAWYAGTFFLILALLGIGMFAVITNRFDRDLDASLRDASRRLASLSRDGSTATALYIPDRRLFVVDTSGMTATATGLDPWLVELARRAANSGEGQASFRGPGDLQLRAHATRIESAGQPRVAIAVADEIELEDRYASLIAAFGAAALVAVVLVAAGGWMLARQSLVPIERSIAHMQRFMADAAHELRTPLTVIRSRAEVALQRARANDEYVQALRAVEGETIRVGRIVEDLLMLARADTGERPIAHERVFLDDVTLDAAEAARAMAERKAVRLEVDSFEEGAVTGDAELLRQLVLILLDNAIKFTDASGVVRIGVRAAGAGPRLVVSDTGKGIAAEDLPHVFERFYRADPSRLRAESPGGGASEGAGLGLAIAQWIVEEHGATIRIDSRPGQGTEVTVQFPPAVSEDGLSSS